MAKSWLSPESRLSFGAAVACMSVGSVGWLFNYLVPGATHLGALMVVGCLYLLTGLTNMKPNNL